nr:hypothetical protein [uncultured Hyphomonas sp.]
MKTRLLNAAEFRATFEHPMRDVLETATSVIDIWPYVAAIPVNELFGSLIIDGSVQHAYRNRSDTFDHVLVVTQTPNVFVVVIVDLVRNEIFGHHLLDLNQEYGLSVEH